uniref:Uncharacterized protein n=1 Tax=Anguilla anguilla TaxID=7936 RepID=A0A0E9TB84_ANGAN
MLLCHSPENTFWFYVKVLPLRYHILYSFTCF